MTLFGLELRVMKVVEFTKPEVRIEPQWTLSLIINFAHFQDQGHGDMGTAFGGHLTKQKKVKY